ncbi:Uncharacterized protein GBIM_19872 [Gryllus bimaculatus]|nr:Uncharacterized protein GBIM_19872 [Gryllus bimaculatus]
METRCILAIDTQAFIEDIKAHPVIWDLNLDEHRVESTRSLAWDAICYKYIPNYARKSVQEKRDAVATLQRKWKSLRDSFTRELAKVENSKGKNDPATLYRKPYYYFEELSFLLGAIAPRKRKGVADKPEPEAGLTQPKPQETTVPRIASGNPIPENHSTKKEKKSHIFIETDNKIVTVNNSQNLNETQTHQMGDADRNFVLSLIPHLKQIPEEYKLDVQSEILLTMKKYKPYGRQMYNQPYGYCPPSFSLPHQPISTSQIAQSTPPAQPPVATHSSRFLKTRISKNAKCSKKAPSPVISTGTLGSTDDDPVIENIV